MSRRVKNDEFMNDNLEDMIRDIRVDIFKKAHVEDTLQSRYIQDANFLQDCQLF